MLRTQSVKKDPYFVELTLNGEREVVSAFCRCKAGIQGQCKHASAVVYAVNREHTESRTDHRQQWGAGPPKNAEKHLYAKGKSMEAIFGYEKVPAPNFSRSWRLLST